MEIEAEEENGKGPIANGWETHGAASTSHINLTCSHEYITIHVLVPWLVYVEVTCQLADRLQVISCPLFRSIQREKKVNGRHGLK
jgi:hypothetical protein